MGRWFGPMNKIFALIPFILIRYDIRIKNLVFKVTNFYEFSDFFTDRKVTIILSALANSRVGGFWFGFA
jgi:hypothetical protein